MQGEPDKEQLLKFLKITTDDLTSWGDGLKKQILLSIGVLKEKD
jgi:hypothetical protein